MNERKEQQKLLMKQLLEEANIPALSAAWYQKEKGTRHAVAYGQADTQVSSPVDTKTLFQAASLSKPVAAAIVLDLIEQDKDKPNDDKDKWTLNTTLFQYDPEYGPEELRTDPNYKNLTIGMIIGQRSGLANYGEEGDDGKKFIATPESRFTYSGVALDFLQKVIEKKTGKEWEEIAQDFFRKVRKAGMANSTFKRQSPDSHLHGIPRDVAKAHVADTPDGHLAPLPPLPDDAPGTLAGLMLTTAEDYITFLQYCFKNEYLHSTLLQGDLDKLPPTLPPDTSRVKWGLGMGIYSEGDPQNPKRTIAFHWGNNKGSVSFCAMDMATGNCVVCFSNSMNGPSVFQQIAKPVVGDLTPLFQWLSTYCNFNDVNQPEKPEVIATTVQSIHSLADSALPKPADSTQTMLLLMPSVSTPGLNPVESQEQTTTAQASAQHDVGEESDEEQTSQEFNPTPFSNSPNP
jgi:CubicO group peptidase (beta-lactamase class C family)